MALPDAAALVTRAAAGRRLWHHVAEPARQVRDRLLGPPRAPRPPTPVGVAARDAAPVGRAAAGDATRGGVTTIDPARGGVTTIDRDPAGGAAGASGATPFDGPASGSGATPVVLPEAGRRLGLHVTEQELAVWRERAQRGPYRVAGDAIPNSPGDWERIRRHAARFREQPTEARWPGPTHNGGVVLASTRWPRDPSGMPPRLGAPERLRDAAFHAMVAAPPDTAAVVAAIRRELLWHTAQPALDFSDPRRFGPQRIHWGYHPGYQIAAWLRKLAYAFDYARIAAPDQWGPDEEQQVLEWLAAAARWYMGQIDAHRAGMWRADGTPSPAAERWGGWHARPVWAGGPVTRRIQHRYNNHVNRFAVLVADVGVLTGDERMLAYGRRWVREFLEVAVYPQGAVADFYRWDDPFKGHTQGWKYGTMMVGATMIIADHLARAGDLSAYATATTSGTSTTAGTTPADGLTDGGPKTLLAAARQMARFVDETSEPARYACRDCTDESRRFSSRDPGRGIARADEWHLLQGNVFYRDPYLRAVFDRALPGAPDLPASPKHGLGWLENGDVGAFPAVNLMFARMEEQVWPYPAGARAIRDAQTLPSPTRTPR